MTQQQKVILVAGLAGAFFIMRSKKAGATTRKPVLSTKTGKASTSLPVRGTNSPYLASTGMATHSGGANVPSSGLGYGTTNRGVAQAPSTVGGIAQGAGSALQGLFNWLGLRQPAVTRPASASGPSATKPSASGGGAPSGGGGGGGRESGNSSRTAPLGGAANIANQTESNGYFDGRGAWHAYDGYYDDNGNFVMTDAQGNPLSDYGPTLEQLSPIGSDYGPTPEQLGISDTYGPAAEQAGGSIDENGNYVPGEQPAQEAVYADDVLPSTDLGSGSQSDINNYQTDAIMLDTSTPDGIDDGSFAASDGSGFNDTYLGGGTDSQGDIGGDSFWAE